MSEYPSSENGDNDNHHQSHKKRNQSCVFSRVSTAEENLASKRIKISNDFNLQQKNITLSDEISPLGLKLTKSPSLIKFLKSKLLDGNSFEGRAKKRRLKQKAPHIKATVLKIGNWEKKATRAGGLLAKFYYMTKKIVWEILDGNRKTKIEICWEDIIGINAVIKDNQPGVLRVELENPPTYFRETIPLPRKHTSWNEITDFTGGEASFYRLHTVEFPPRVLHKHYAELLLHDERLLDLSQKPFPSQGIPYYKHIHQIVVTEAPQNHFPDINATPMPEGYAIQNQRSVLYSQGVNGIQVMPTQDNVATLPSKTVVATQGNQAAVTYVPVALEGDMAGLPLTAMVAIPSNPAAFPSVPVALEGDMAGLSSISMGATQGNPVAFPSMCTAVQQGDMAGFPFQGVYPGNSREESRMVDVNKLQLLEIENHFFGDDSEVEPSNESALLATVKAMNDIFLGLDGLNTDITTTTTNNNNNNNNSSVIANAVVSKQANLGFYEFDSNNTCGANDGSGFQPTQDAYMNTHVPVNQQNQSFSSWDLSLPTFDDYPALGSSQNLHLQFD